MYQDPTLKLLIDKLNAEGPVALRNKYYIGDPLIVAESLLPICFVTKDTTTINTEDNYDDRHTMAVVLNVVYKFTKDLNQKAFVHAGTASLYELCEGREADHTLKTNTIAHVLRKYETLDGVDGVHIDIGNDLVIDYNISPPSRRGMFSAEAMIRTSLIAIRPNPAMVIT